MLANAPRIATVFGGVGFIGRHLVPRLIHAGYTVRIACRDTERAMQLRTMGGPGQVVPLFVPITDPAAIARAVAGASVVVNLVGILAERAKGDFARIQGTAPRLIGDAAVSAGVRHLVHLSAIGADTTSPSAYARSKAAGEAAISASFPDAVILRPSVVFGPEDAFFNRFAGLARISPIMPVIAGETRFQPVYVGDVADAIMAALALPVEAPRLYEIGGPEVLTFRAILVYILEQTGRARPLVALSPKLAALQARILERLPGKVLTTDQLTMLQRDNVVSRSLPGLAALGVEPTPIDLVVPGYLAGFGRPRRLSVA